MRHFGEASQTGSVEFLVYTVHIIFRREKIHIHSEEYIMNKGRCYGQVLNLEACYVR